MLKRKKKVIAKVMATTMLASTLAATFTPSASALESRATVSSSTIAGNNRYETAVKVSEAGWTSSTNAVLINGEAGLVDALTATPYANLKNAPILVTHKDKLTPVTKTRLTKMGVKNVDIVGGTSVVSENIVNELKAMKISVNRIAGNSRYTTALAVAEAMDKISDVSKVTVVNGITGLPDAVSVAAPAADNKMPILLSDPKTGLKDSKAFIDRESISKSYVIGEVGAVSNTIMNSLPGTKVRLGGARREETNAKVIKEFYPSTSLDNIYVAKSGLVNRADELVDALAVGALAAKKDAPVLIVGKTLDASQETLLKDKAFTSITQVGGGIPSNVIDSIKATQNSVKDVTTTSALNSALSTARDGDTINFRPTSTVSENITLSTSANITVNLYGTHSGAVNSNMSNATLNIYGNISNTLAVDSVKSVNVNSGVTVKQLDVKSGARNTIVTNRGTVTILNVVATGVKISGSGNITTLNAAGDTDFSGFTGNIGNLDKSKPVSQIIVQNAKEIVIRFSKPLDSVPRVGVTGNLATVGNSVTESATESNISISDLSSNRMSLTITAGEGKYFKGTYGIYVSEMTSNSIALDEYRTTVIADDKTGPSAQTSKFNQSEDQFEIDLSEPIENLNNIVLRVNNQPISTASLNSDKNKIIFERPNGVALNTNVSIYLTGLKDAAGNVMSSYNGTIKTTSDTLKVDTVSQLSNKKIKLIFNKKLDINSHKNMENSIGISVYKKNGSTVSTDAEYIDIKQDMNDKTGRTYIITSENLLATSGVNKDSQSIRVSILKDSFTDEIGSKIAAVTKDITLNRDKTAPTVKESYINNAKTAIEVRLSEDILDTIEESKIHIRLNGVNLSESSISASLKEDTTDTIKITTGSNLEAGEYQIRLDAGAFEDLNEVANKEVTLAKLIVEQGSSNALNISEIKNGVSANVFEIVSPKDEKFTLDSLSSSKFKLDGKEMPKETDVYFKGNGRETIIVALNSVDSVNLTGPALLTASGLKLESEKALNSKTETVKITDNTAPTLQSVKTIINKNNTNEVQIKLTFDENMGSVDTIENIKDELIIRKGSGTSEKIYNWATGDEARYSVSGKELIITLTKKSVDSNLFTEIIKHLATDVSIEVKENATIIKDHNNVTARNKKVTSSRVATEATI